MSVDAAVLSSDVVRTNLSSNATDVAALLQATLGAVSTEGRSHQERLNKLEKVIAALAEEVSRLKPPKARQEVSTQTNESGSPEFEALKARVNAMEQLLHGGVPQLHEAFSSVTNSAIPELGSSEQGEEEEQQRNEQWERWKEQELQAKEKPHWQADGPSRNSDVLRSSENAASLQSPRGTGAMATPRAQSTCELIAPASPQLPAAPMNSPPESRAARPPLRVELPSVPPPPAMTRESSYLLATSMAAPARLRAEVLPRTERHPSVKGPESMLERLRKCEELHSYICGWQARITDPLRAELDGLRAASTNLANKVDILTAGKLDHSVVQIWCNHFAAQVGSIVSALQDEARDDKRQVETRLAQAQAQMASLSESIASKADREDLSRLEGSLGVLPTPAPRGDMNPGDERLRRLRDNLMKMHDELMERKADRSDLKMLEDALLSHMKPRSAVTSAVPLNDRFSLVTPFLGALADARTSATYQERRAALSPPPPHARSAPKMPRPASAGRLFGSPSQSGITEAMMMAGTTSPSPSITAKLLPEESMQRHPEPGARLARPSSASVVSYRKPALAPDRQITGSDGRLYH